MGQIAAALINFFSESGNQKIINPEIIRNVESRIDENLKAVKNPGLSAPGHAVHTLYSSIQNFVSLMAEYFSSMEALAEFARKVEKAQQIYMPGYPPTSPVTQSLFYYWALFDLACGADKETIGTCLLDMERLLSIDAQTAALIKALQATRLGIYLHQGFAADGAVELYEFFTQQKIKCFVTTRYQGAIDQIWLVRLAPHPLDPDNRHITLTTPYVIQNAKAGDWESFLQRVLPQSGSYEHLMKYGLAPYYWNEYVFRTYSKHLDNVIFLNGLPGY